VVFELVKTGLSLGPSLSRPKDQTGPDFQTLTTSKAKDNAEHQMGNEDKHGTGNKDEDTMGNEDENMTGNEDEDITGNKDQHGNEDQHRMGNEEGGGHSMPTQ